MSLKEIVILCGTIYVGSAAAALGASFEGGSLIVCVGAYLTVLGLNLPNFFRSMLVGFIVFAGLLIIKELFMDRRTIESAILTGLSVIISYIVYYKFDSVGNEEDSEPVSR